MSAFQGMVPLELFGHTRFPAIGSTPYFLTLGPHAFYWFTLQPQRLEVAATAERALPTLSVPGQWDAVLHNRHKSALEALLPDYLRARRWFGGKARTIETLALREAIPVPREEPLGYLTLVGVEYTEGEPETYSLPLTFVTGEQALRLQGTPAAIARLRVQGRQQEQEGLLCDALWDREFSKTLLALIARGRRLPAPAGELVATPTRPFRRLLRSSAALEPALLRAEQSNTSVVYGDLFILKLYRRLDEGLNPDLEIGRYLTEVCQFANTAPVAGALEYRRQEGEPLTLAILQSFLPVQGDAWQYTLDSAGRYYEQVLARRAELGEPPLPAKSLLELSADAVPALVEELAGLYLEAAQLLGQRTGELHVALAQAKDDPNFAPEPFTDFYRRSLYQSMMVQANQTLQLLRQRLDHLPAPDRPLAQQLLDLQAEVRRRFQAIRDRRIGAIRIRCHGDYHLGQVLYTGKDFIIIDFEGEPARPLSVRRMKRSPLRDVAGMLRSFHYAAYGALLEHGGIRPEDIPALEPWARFWYLWVSAVFLKKYLEVVAPAALLPANPEHLRLLLDAYLLEKALYELAYELNNRPDWVRIPLHGLLQLLAPPA
ncbi:MAG: hypothetical protein KatS3mg131_1528 [Candidatus Tectimicrobiota bacterium]|nr:MAG: hypothetical protein KatS3mg131_1528 [Candidatus Tectomicrobia bacterium]